MNNIRHLLSAALATSVWLWLPSVQAQSVAASAEAVPANCPALLNHRFPRLQDETPQDLCQFAGKVVLVVNTASYCGYTNQYAGLETLYAKYQQRGLVVLGFPSNDFGNQEPGDKQAIADLCFNTYGVEFPMFSKSAVVGSQRNLFYTQLFQATKAAPQWNFHKYLIARDGVTVTSFPSAMAPGSAPITAAIEAALVRP